MPRSDTLLLAGGTFLTLDPAMPRAAACLSIDGRIAAVGSVDHVRAAAPRGTPEVDLAGATVTPGFNDAHVHVWKVGQLHADVLDVRGVESIPELQRRLREFGAGLPSAQWIQARGYNEALLAEGRHPTRHDLDAAFPDRPAYLVRTCAHIAVANTYALELADIGPHTAPPPGGEIDRDATGMPTGVLRETALGLVTRHIPPPTTADVARMIIAGHRHQLSLGITSATDPAVTPELIAAYRRLEEQDHLLVRMNLMAIRRPDGGTETLPLPERHVSPRLRIDSVKFFADGGLSGATAALRSDYRHAPTRGVLRFEAEELFELALPAHRAGLRIGTHAIGDAAIGQVLDVYTQLRQAHPSPVRHRVEHLGLPDATHLARMAAGGFIAVPQAIFLRELGMNFRRYLTDEYLARAYPLRSMLDAGIAVALSSDAPVVRDDDPISGMMAAMDRRDAEGVVIAPDQAITAAEALHAYTVGGAIASGDDANRGRIAVGMLADFAVMDADPLGMNPLVRPRVMATYVGGECVYTRG